MLFPSEFSQVMPAMIFGYNSYRAETVQRHDAEAEQ